MQRQCLSAGGFGAGTNWATTGHRWQEGRTGARYEHMTESSPVDRVAVAQYGLRCERRE